MVAEALSRAHLSNQYALDNPNVLIESRSGLQLAPCQGFLTQATQGQDSRDGGQPQGSGERPG